MTKLAGSLMAVAVVVAACGPSDPMQSREAKECRQLLAVQEGWGDVFADAKWQAERNKRDNEKDRTDPLTLRMAEKGFPPRIREENVFKIAEQIGVARDRLVATCVLKMKGGQ